MNRPHSLTPHIWLLAAAFFSAAFQAFGMYQIHAQSAITEGGILGLTLLLHHHWSVSPAVSGLLLNAFCYVLGFKTMGKHFLTYSAISSLGFSVGYGFFERFTPLWPGIGQMPLLCAITGAIFVGIGSGICVRVGGAITGDDALAMSLCRILKKDIRWIYLASDLLVLSLSLTYIPAKRILYSLLTVLLSGQIIGWIQKIPFNLQQKTGSV